MNFFTHIAFLSAIILVYVVAFITIRPFMLNYKRKYSTLALKLSYLVYLAFFLGSLYCLIFFGGPELEKEFRDTFFIISIAVVFSPNLGMMIRRSIKRNRVFFNCFFTGVNLFVIYYIYYLLTRTDWSF